MSGKGLCRDFDGPECIDIDKQGDLTLILYRQTATSDTIQATQDNIKEDNPTQTALAGDNRAQGVSSQQVESVEQKHVSQPLSTSVEPIPAEDIEEIHVRVSSKQLILASPKFAAQFQGNWPEARILREKGHLQLPLPDDDANCWIMLLDYLHHKNERTARLVSLETLTKVALIVDKYQLYRGISILSSLWMKGREWLLPEDFGKEVVSLMWIAWVFRYRKVFWGMTKLAKQKSAGTIDTYDLPIHDQIISDIEKDRKSLTDRMVSILHETRENFLKPQDGCRYDCDAKHLGILTRELYQLGLLGDGPQELSQTLSPSDLIDKVNDTVIAQLHANDDCRGIRGQKLCPNYEIDVKIQRRLKGIYDETAGIDLGPLIPGFID